MPFRDKLPHLIVRGSASSEDYTSPKSAPRPKFPERNRAEHANHLLNQMRASDLQAQQKRTSLPAGAPAPDGLYLEFEGKAGFDLKLQSLDLPSQGIELLSVKVLPENNSEKTVATVFVPNDKVATFIKKVEEYRDQETAGGSPKNSPLINGIENVRLAVVRSLWTDLDGFPDENENIWWEVWLRATADAIPKFTSFAQARNIQVSQRILRFPDRHVILAHTNVQTLATSIDSLGFIAELRRAKETAADFLQMPGTEQTQWINAMAGLLNQPDPAQSPVVCILDTGVHHQHPLINPFLPNHKLLTCNPQWNTNDHHGHGTQMSGLVLYGDLNNALVSTQRIDVPCEIESVKILPPTGQNHPDLYGNITEEAVNRATIAEPDRDRIVCMAVTTTDYRDRGQPSSWSAALDNVCVGKSVEGKKHLFIVSAGNTALHTHINYPNSNITDQVHDPGQSWNALTIGAHTDKITITEAQFNGWSPLASAGDIAPGTTTSVTWMKNKWPIKPDVVFEGGNAAINPARTEVSYPNSLLLLTTDRDRVGQSLTWTADTSAAAAQAANMAALIANKYPNYWPETLRALMVHSAEWTPRMRMAYPIGNKTQRENLLRTCGFGVPNMTQALTSASNHLTLIAQDELKPFEGSKMKQLNIHNIPWPTDVLRGLGETQVKMRVTLSYFIEPNPARRGWSHKFRYQSHGLRFDVKTPTESTDEFVTRLNRKRWDEEEGRDSVTTSGDSAEWFFGEHIRSKGSLHSDIWEGTAVSLAERSQIAVYPVVGWWRERHAEGHTEKSARYSLIISISTPSTDIDLYTPVETQVVTEVEAT